MSGAVSTAVTDGGVPDILACVHCGFCLPACPTYRMLGDENDSPRGRLYLMRAADEGRVSREGAFALHVGRCLGCRACETVCPAGVPFGSLLERAREAMPRRRRHAWPERAALALLTGPAAAVVYAVLRAVRDSGVAGLLGRLPGRPGRAARLLAATRRRQLHQPGATARATAAAGSDLPRADSGSAGTPYALLEGCVMAGLFGHVQRATRRVLTRRGYRERHAGEQVCCGALHAHAGRLAEASALARRNIEAFERVDVRWIVVDSAGCGAALRDYPVWLADSPEWEPRARAVAARVRDVTELVAGGGSWQTGAEEGGADPEGAGRRHALRVAYDAPCHLLHGQGVREEPLEMLRRIEGVEVEPLGTMESCCGGAGLYNLAQPDLADRLLEPKLEEIRSGRFDVLATGNPGCIMYIGAGLKRAGDRLPVMHPVELVDRSDGSG